MVLTRSAKLYERAVRMSDLGLYRAEHQTRTPGREPMFPGSNFRMSEMTAAVALAQLARVAPMIRKVRASRDAMRAQIGEIPGVTWRRIPDPKGDIGFETYLFMPTAEQARAVRARAGSGESR